MSTPKIIPNILHWVGSHQLVSLLIDYLPFYFEDLFGRIKQESFENEFDLLLAEKYWLLEFIICRILLEFFQSFWQIELSAEGFEAFLFDAIIHLAVYRPCKLWCSYTLSWIFEFNDIFVDWKMMDELLHWGI